MKNSNIDFTNKKILITGGAGFIGSNFVWKILKNENAVLS